MKPFKPLAILSFCLFGLAAFSSFTARENHLYLGSVQDKPVPTTITLTYTGGEWPITYGTFTSEGGLTTSGTATMVIHEFGNVWHCLTTFTSEQGTFTIREECNRTTYVGQWQIMDGTGAYENLHGNGKLAMPDWGTIYTGKISWLNKD